MCSEKKLWSYTQIDKNKAVSLLSIESLHVLSAILE